MNFNFKICLLFFFVTLNFLTFNAFSQQDESSSSEIGLMSAYYQYEEPNLMSIKAINVALDYTGIMVFGKNWFIRGDLIGALSGATHYSSSNTGTMDGFPNWYIDTRALFGRNLFAEDLVLAPYTGVGYRYLHNDMRGKSTTGANGYRRKSNYLYVPLGLINKLELTGQSKLIITMELDGLILGKQITHLSDAGGYYEDFNSKQKSGYGGRLNFMYQQNNWSIGPYLVYWHVGDSECALGPMYCSQKDAESRKYGCKQEGEWVSAIWLEPKSYTIEAGLKISYRF
jgi:hypothetical protein